MGMPLRRLVPLLALLLSLFSMAVASRAARSSPGPTNRLLPPAGGLGCFANAFAGGLAPLPVRSRS